MDQKGNGEEGGAKQGSTSLEGSPPPCIILPDGHLISGGHSSPDRAAQDAAESACSPRADAWFGTLYTLGKEKEQEKKVRHDEICLLRIPITACAVGKLVGRAVKILTQPNTRCGTALRPPFCALLQIFVVARVVVEFSQLILFTLSGNNVGAPCTSLGCRELTTTFRPTDRLTTARPYARYVGVAHQLPRHFLEVRQSAASTVHEFLRQPDSTGGRVITLLQHLTRCPCSPAPPDGQVVQLSSAGEPNDEHAYRGPHGEYL